MWYTRQKSLVPVELVLIGIITLLKRLAGVMSLYTFIVFGPERPWSDTSSATVVSTQQYSHSSATIGDHLQPHAVLRLGVWLAPASALLSPARKPHQKFVLFLITAFPPLNPEDPFLNPSVNNNHTPPNEHVYTPSLNKLRSFLFKLNISFNFSNKKGYL